MRPPLSRRLQVADQAEPVLADAAADLGILVADLGGAPVGGLAALAGRQGRQQRPQIVERPAQVHRRRARLQQHRVGAGQHRVGRIGRHGQRHAVGRGGADQRRAAHDHGADRHARRPPSCGNRARRSDGAAGSGRSPGRSCRRRRARWCGKVCRLLSRRHFRRRAPPRRLSPPYRARRFDRGRECHRTGRTSRCRAARPAGRAPIPAMTAPADGRPSPSRCAHRATRAPAAARSGSAERSTRPAVRPRFRWAASQSVWSRSGEVSTSRPAPPKSRTTLSCAATASGVTAPMATMATSAPSSGGAYQ